MYSKSIPIGSAGSIVISEDAGAAKVVVSLSEMSGGSLPGVAKGVLSAEVDVSAVLLVNALLGLAAVKYPSAASLISGLQTIVDAEIAQL